MKKFLKNLLLRNCWSDFEIISQECSLGDPFQKLFTKFWSVHKYGSGEWGLLAQYGHEEEILKKSSCLKSLVRFWNNFTGMFLVWPLSKTVRKILIHPKTWLLWMGASCAILTKKFLKNLLLRNCWFDFEIISQECSLGDPFQKLFAKFWSIQNMALVNGSFLHYTYMKKFLKNLLLRNCWSDFEIISQECSLGDPFQKLFAKFWSVHKHGSGEWGLLALYGHEEEILKKSSCLKQLVRFWNNFTGMFLVLSFSKIVPEILIHPKTWLWWMGASCTILT